MLDVSTLAESIARNFPSRPAAYWWIRTAVLEQFEGQTPLQVLMEGRYEVLLRHLRIMMKLEEPGEVDAGRFVDQEDVEAWLRDVIVPAYDVYRSPRANPAREGRAEIAPRDVPAGADLVPENLGGINRRMADEGQKFVTLEQVRAALSERHDRDLFDRLNEPLTLRAFTGPRSATAALEACRILMSGDAAATIKWMNQRLFRSDFTPLELAEQDDEGLQIVLDIIGRIDAGVYF